MRKLLLMLAMAMLLSGCYSSVLMKERRITMPNGDTYTVLGRSDDMISFDTAGLKITVDGRSKTSFFTDIAKLMVTKTSVNLSNKDQINKD